MSVVPYDFLVSRSARDRYVRWKEDLRRAGGGPTTPDTPMSTSSTGGEEVDIVYEERVRAKQRRDHTNALLSATWNEGQPDSPQAESPTIDNSSRESIRYFPSHAENSNDCSPGPSDNSIKGFPNSSATFLPRSRSPSNGLSGDSNPTKRARYGTSRTSDGNQRTQSLLGPHGNVCGGSKSMDDASKPLGDIVIGYQSNQAEGNDGSLSPDKAHRDPDGYFITENIILDRTAERRSPRAGGLADDEDFITDTVGAIAIDAFGNIAAGSSSGGIGMKHRGRVGPAALVGIGTAVIPVDSLDADGITVAAVTSGTGEHMATTMASQKCAERLYYCTKRGPAGVSVPASDEEAMQSFVRDDFMGHASVKNSLSTGAIGVMAVKKTPFGFFLHFAHNTESFALASMHSNEKDAKCVMSRMGDHTNAVVQGGRKIRCD
jgi:taspase, threonine aspartase, 1